MQTVKTLATHIALMNKFTKSSSTMFRHINALYPSSWLYTHHTQYDSLSKTSSLFGDLLSSQKKLGWNRWISDGIWSRSGTNIGGYSRMQVCVRKGFCSNLKAGIVWIKLHPESRKAWAIFCLKRSQSYIDRVSLR